MSVIKREVRSRIIKRRIKFICTIILAILIFSAYNNTKNELESVLEANNSLQAMVYEVKTKSNEDIDSLHNNINELDKLTNIKFDEITKQLNDIQSQIDELEVKIDE